MTRRLGPHHILAITSAAIFALVFLNAVFVVARHQAHWSSQVVWGYAAAAILYFISHAARATRLSMIAMPMLGISFRTGYLLHLFVAPWSLILPFKVDELVRLRELHHASRSLTRSLTVILIDRSMDGVVLILLSGLLLDFGRTAIAGFVGFVGIGLTVIALGFFTVPVLLEAVQRHIFAHHYRPRALHVLSMVSHLRELLEISRRTIGAAFPFLALSTLAIWALELAATASFLASMDDPVDILSAIEVMLRRAEESWKVIAFPATVDPQVMTLSLLFTIALLVPWPFITLSYARRVGAEPVRPRLPQQTGFSLFRLARRS